MQQDEQNRASQHAVARPPGRIGTSGGELLDQFVAFCQYLSGDRTGIGVGIGTRLGDPNEDSGAIRIGVDFGDGSSAGFGLKHVGLFDDGLHGIGGALIGLASPEDVQQGGCFGNPQSLRREEEQQYRHQTGNDQHCQPHPDRRRAGGKPGDQPGGRRGRSTREQQLAHMSQHPAPIQLGEPFA